MERKCGCEVVRSKNVFGGESVTAVVHQPHKDSLLHRGKGPSKKTQTNAFSVKNPKKPLCRHYYRNRYITPLRFRKLLKERDTLLRVLRLLLLRTF